MPRAPHPLVSKYRSAKAVAVLKGDEKAAAQADIDLKAAKVRAYLERVVSEAPPLSQARRDELARILRSGKA